MLGVHLQIFPVNYALIFSLPRGAGAPAAPKAMPMADDADDDDNDDDGEGAG